jgi:hypothetical protein
MYSHSVSFKYFVLKNGQTWDVERACFSSAAPDGAPIVEASDEMDLEERLRFYGLPLGEFKRDADYATEVRNERNRLISATDYLVMPDYPLDEEKKAAVLAYRQALRDVPEQAGFPRQIDWPTKP